jgi:hypothetical protein
MCIRAGALTALARATCNDVRSCINTLQFLAQRRAEGKASPETGENQGAITTSQGFTDDLWGIIESGVKDEHADIFQVSHITTTE